MQRSVFISIVAPVAVKVRIDGGVLFPSVSIAQTLLETGGVIHPWNNLVGYKVGLGRTTPYWDGRSVSAETWEVYEGVRYDNVTSNFRAYDTIEDCLKDQALLFLNNRGRYQRVIDADTPEEQAEALRLSGYATDPDYDKKIINIIRSYFLKQYDKEAEEGMEAIKEMQRQIDDMKEQLKQYEELSELKELQQQVDQIMKLVQEGQAPDWAKKTIDKLVASKLLNDPKGDRSFFRTLVVLDRAGVFDKKSEKA